jgi:hypothetical protein
MKEKHLENIPAASFYASSQRIRRRVAECAIRVAKDNLAFEIESFLANSLVAVVLIAKGDHDGSIDLVQVVQPVANLKFERKQVGQIDRWINGGKIVFSAEAAQEGFR